MLGLLDIFRAQRARTRSNSDSRGSASCFPDDEAEFSSRGEGVSSTRYKSSSLGGLGWGNFAPSFPRSWRISISSWSAPICVAGDSTVSDEEDSPLAAEGAVSVQFTVDTSSAESHILDKESISQTDSGLPG